jgi:uncharacterized protein
MPVESCEHHPESPRSVQPGSVASPQRKRRADDFVWPRREVGSERAKGEDAMASASPDGISRVTAPAKSLKSKKHRRRSWDRSHLFTVFGGMVREPAFARSNIW